MRKGLFIAGIAALLLTSCGVKKDYVAQQISDSESRTNAQLATVNQRLDATAEEIRRLDQLSAELNRKADMALNQAAGFENYQVIWSGDVTFAFDQADINDESLPILDEAGQVMDTVKKALVEIAGHTDPVGSRSYNYVLADRRANAARAYMADKYSIPLYRMFIISHGEDQPLSMPDERNSNAKNRRVSIKIWAPMLQEGSTVDNSGS